MNIFYKPTCPFTYIFHKYVDKYYESSSQYHFYGYGLKIKKISDKYNTLKTHLSFDFLKEPDINTILDLYGNSFRVYSVFHRFYKNHEAKKAKDSGYHFDLSMSPLENYSERMKISLIHENCKYHFKIHDLMRLVFTSLILNDDLHCDPTFPRNPFNNIKFTTHNMYILYFTMKEREIYIPRNFELFFRANFDITVFYRENEQYIRSTAIDNYHKQFSYEDLYEEIIMMLRLISPYGLSIHPEFPKDNIIKTFTPFITYYWHSLHNYSTENRAYYKNLFNKKLNTFINENKTYGRVILKRNNSNLNNNDNVIGVKNFSNTYSITNLLSNEIPYDLSSIDDILDYITI